MNTTPHSTGGLSKYYVVSLVLQLAHVFGAELSPAIGNLAAPLGVGIPLVVGAWYGAKGPTGYGQAAGQGFLIGGIPALVGLIVAFLLGHVEAFLLVAGSLSSAVAGVIGAVVLYAIRGKQAAG